MVAEGFGIVFHVIEYVRSHVACLGIDVVVIVAGGLSLQQVAIVEQDESVVVFLSQRVDIRLHPSQRTRLVLVFDKVVWEESAVNVAGFYNSDFNGFLLCHSLRIECERQEQRCQNLFHNLPFFVLQCKITKKKSNRHTFC